MLGKKNKDTRGKSEKDIQGFSRLFVFPISDEVPQMG